MFFDFILSSNGDGRYVGNLCFIDVLGTLHKINRILFKVGLKYFRKYLSTCINFIGPI